MVKKKKTGSKIFFAVSKLLLFIAFSVYALMNVYGYRIDVSNQSIQETGVIEVRAWPGEVSVLLDGQKRSDSAPYEIGGVETGQHILRLEKKDFLPIERLITVERQYVVRLGTLFLLPEHAAEYMLQFAFQTPEVFQTENYFVVYSSLQKRLALYPKLTGGEWKYGDVPWSSTLRSVVEVNSGELLFLTSENVYRLPLSQMTFQELSLFPDIEQIAVSKNNPDELLYLKKNVLYSYDRNQEKHNIVAQEVLEVTEQNGELWICSREHKLSQYATKTEFILSADCPVKKIWMLGSHRVILTDAGDLWIDNELLQTNVQESFLLEKGRLIYITERGVYVYDSLSQERILLTRFEGDIHSFTLGPDANHYFVFANDALSFCNIKNKFCQSWLTLAEPIEQQWYNRDEQELVFLAGKKLYSLSFAFWR